MLVEEILSSKKNNVSIHVCKTFSCFFGGGGSKKDKADFPKHSQSQ